MKYYSLAFYNRAAHEDGSRAAHEIELTCSTQKITLVSHASSVRVTQQKYKNTRVLPHASVNLMWLVFSVLMWLSKLLFTVITC